MKRIKHLCLLILFYVISLHAISQKAYDYPYAQDSIVLVKGAPDKGIVPFDKPFYLVLNPKNYNFDNTQVLSVFAYKIRRRKGNRELIHQNPDITFTLNNTYDTTAGRLAINFPALRPNKDFDISIHFSLSAAQRLKLLKIIDAFNNSDATSAGNAFNAVKQDLTFSNAYTKQRTSFGYGDENKYYTAKKIVLTPIIANIRSVSYLTFSFAGSGQIKTVFEKADATKTTNDVLYLLGSTALATTDVQKGILPLAATPGETAEELDVLTRLKNLTITLAVLKQIKNVLWQTDLKTGDATVQAVEGIINADITNISTNIGLLETLKTSIITATDDGGDSYQAIWLIGSNKNYNLGTRGGSILSTEVGVTNLTLRNNSNKTENIQKLYTGINIFFRSVDRNLPTAHMRRSGKYDFLASRETILQHLSLSLGLTFGDFDQTDINKKDFQGLFNSMSLLVGPSYRFCRAFRFGAGAVILKRLNPNPLITGTVPTVGFYSSFSIDFDFISTISNVTTRFLK